MRFSPILIVVFCSSLCWLLLFSVVPPQSQNFPLDDDWAFARGAFAFADGQGIHYFNWSSVPLLGQWLWAWPFIRLFGETHWSLRISTIIVSWAGLWAFYDLLVQEGFSPREAGWRAGTLAFHPLFFLLQGTYMSDVPTLSFALVGLAFFGKTISGNKIGSLPMAMIAMTLATLNRQSMVIVPLTAGLMLARSDKRNRPLVWLAGVLLPMGAGAAAYLLSARQPDLRPLLPSWPRPEVVALMPFQLVHFLGLSTLPILVAEYRPKSWNRLLICLGIMLAGAGYWMAQPENLPYGGLFPYQHNILTPWGAFAGAANHALQPGDRQLILGDEIRWVLTLLGSAAGAAWLEQLIARLTSKNTLRALLTFSFLQLPIIFFTPVFHDRYLLSLLPGAMSLGEDERPALGLRRMAGGAMLAAFAFCSLGLMHDWLVWNSARWHLGRAAVDEGISPADIEGGLEWDGWWTSVPRHPVPLPTPRLASPYIHQSFPEITGQYALSFSPLPHSRVVKSEVYRLWLNPGTWEFYLLRYDAGQ
jgi:hypothetical protein